MFQFITRTGLCFLLLLATSLFTLTQATARDSFASFLKPQIVDGDNSDFASAVVVSSTGQLVYTGYTYSQRLMGTDISQRSNQNESDVYVANWNPDTGESQLITIIAGNGQDISRDIALDEDGNIYVLIETNSDDLIVTDQNFKNNGAWNAYIAKISPDGNTLAGFYFGGTEDDLAHAFVLKENQIYIVGETRSKDFPTTDNALIADCKTAGICNSTNAFLSQLIMTEDRIEISYSTLFGGGLFDSLHSITVDDNDFVHVAGESNSLDVPLAFPSFENQSGDYDGIFALFKLDNENNNGLVYSTYLGGTQYDSIRQVSYTPEGHSILIGETSSDDFPVSSNALSQSCGFGKTPCYQQQHVHTDIFVTLIDHSNHKVPKYSTKFGGNNDDIPLATDFYNGQLYVVGASYSNDFPVTRKAKYKEMTCSVNCTQPHLGIIFRLDLDRDKRKSLTYSSYWDSEGYGSLVDIAIDDNDAITLLGNHSIPLATAQATSSNDDIFLDQHGIFDQDSIKGKKSGFFGSLFLIDYIGFLFYFCACLLIPINKFDLLLAIYRRSFKTIRRM